MPGVHWPLNARRRVHQRHDHALRGHGPDKDSCGISRGLADLPGVVPDRAVTGCAGSKSGTGTLADRAHVARGLCRRFTVHRRGHARQRRIIGRHSNHHLHGQPAPSADELGPVDSLPRRLAALSGPVRLRRDRRKFCRQHGPLQPGRLEPSQRTRAQPGDQCHLVCQQRGRSLCRTVHPGRVTGHRLRPDRHVYLPAGLSAARRSLRLHRPDRRPLFRGDIPVAAGQCLRHRGIQSGGNRRVCPETCPAPPGSPRMTARNYILLILCMGAVTYLPRMLPLVALSRRRLPAWFTEWLELIPAAILSALLAPSLLTCAEPRTFCFGKPELLAAVPTLLFALRTHSLAGTVIVGMLCYWGLKLMM